jgi:hypothetical protein
LVQGLNLGRPLSFRCPQACLTGIWSD